MKKLLLHPKGEFCPVVLTRDFLSVFGEGCARNLLQVINRELGGYLARRQQRMGTSRIEIGDDGWLFITVAEEKTSEPSKTDGA